MEDNTFESQQCRWNSMILFELGSVRDELEDSAAALPRADDPDHGLHPSTAGITEHVTVGPRAGADACPADAPVGGHSVADPPANEGPVQGHAAEGHVSQASGAVTRHAGSEHVAPHPANPHFGPQTTASGATFIGQSGERRSENGAYADIPRSFPRGREVVSVAAQNTVVLATVSVHTMSTTTLTSTMVTCTAQGILPYATCVMVLGPPYAGATFGQPVRMPVVSQAVEQSGYFHSGWPGPVSQNAVTGNYGGFWGDAAARSFLPPGFDYNQIASRPVGRPVIPVVPGEQYLGHGQYMDPAAIARPDVKPNIGHDTRPKTTDFAGQTAVAWTEAGSRAVSSGHGASERSSNAREVGHVLSGNLRQADPPWTVRDCPQARIDAPIRSTPVQSPMFHQDPSTGLFVPVFSNIAQLPYANAMPDSRTAGFNAEARGMSMQGTEIVDVSQSATGSSSQPPMQSTSSASAGGREKPETPLVQPQRFDSRGSLDTFLLQFEQLSEYMRWGERECRYHLVPAW